MRGFLRDDEYRALQAALLLRPEQGLLIQGSGGLRKIRWGTRSGGKRGGHRIIYYWDGKSETFYMLFIYAKSEREDLTREQIKALREIVREEFK
ncbi:MAG: type II toxin-antitoxin system RelE/ParE family toxin [Spirochaetales bacterium]|nr:type II toxin-antitoxin system RelE/ParE family toxin [Spirochaetales bacterium]